MILDRTARQETDSIAWNVIAHCFRGSPILGGCLWTVVEITTKATGKVERSIGLDLIRRWGRSVMAYKDMKESSHPFYYSCPLKYLAMVPVACEEWRKHVVEYHARKRAEREKRKCTREE